MIIFGSNIRVICKRWREEGGGDGGEEGGRNGGEEGGGMEGRRGGGWRGGGRTGEGVQGGITVGIVFHVSLTTHTSPVRLCDC